MDIYKDAIVFIPLCVLLGLFVGSFLNVVIHRLPLMLEADWRTQAAELLNPAPASALAEGSPPEPFNLAVPRSRCPHCGHLITALENIPVVSYLVLGGKCSHCKASISLRYPFVEAVTALLSGVAAVHFGYGAAALGALLFCWALVALTFIDLDTQLLPDDITLPLLWLGLAFNLNGVFTDLGSAVVGAMAGYLSLWSVYWAFKLATGKEGMGYGDFKLLAAIGAWLGWQVLPLVILLSSVVGAVIGIGMMIFRQHGRETPIPFGPYLAIAGLLAFFWGAEINASYLGLF
ncbi:A24 family peptidase [Zoogloea sp.]|uniref:prepilin peptidase n=1 Tax=Zoogloea sp. TaxID=49181 RepID=UPI0035AF8022